MSYVGNKNLKKYNISYFKQLSEFLTTVIAQLDRLIDTQELCNDLVTREQAHTALQTYQRFVDYSAGMSQVYFDQRHRIMANGSQVFTNNDELFAVDPLIELFPFKKGPFGITSSVNEFRRFVTYVLNNVPVVAQ